MGRLSAIKVQLKVQLEEYNACLEIVYYIHGKHTLSQNTLDMVDYA